MSKGNLFLSQARGKVGSVVFSVLKGQQITRVYNPKPDNPRTILQQAQRSLLANATKFYKFAIANFYKFAFSDKTRYESDYNAFARANIMRGAYLPREMYEDESIMALGDFVLSSGDIGIGASPSWNANVFRFPIGGTLGVSTTVGAVSSQLLQTYPNLAAGDIVTIVVGTSEYPIGGAVAPGTPVWNVFQFRIDPNSAQPTSEVGFGTAESGYLTYSITNSNFLAFGAVVFSRQTSQGLRVSDSVIVGNGSYMTLLEWYRGAYARLQAAKSWGASDEAVLEGALIAKLPTITSISYGLVSISPYSLFFGGGSNLDMSSGVITGENLLTTAEGGRYSADFYLISLITSNEVQAPVVTVNYTATKQDTRIAMAASSTPTFKNGLYGVVLRYNGIPICYGTVQIG